MNKRRFLAATAVAGAFPVQAATSAAPGQAGPVLLTVGGAVGKANRKALDPALDQMMVKHGVKFSQAHAFDAPALQALPRITIRPTVEYDNRPHELAGPLVTTVLGAAGADTKSALRIGMRAVDGYNAILALADIVAYRMIVATHLDGQPLALGGLGPQWAVYEADSIPAFKDKPVNERFALCPWGLYYIDVAPA